VRRGARRPAAVALAVLLVALAAISVRLATSHPQAAGPTCEASTGSATYPLGLEQAANATTIAAVGKRLGLPDHAVTIALAAALQESKLRNLDHGDLDSLGLFQQRPSQGWGTASQIMVPSYAASAFYHRLTMVPGWQTAAVTDAAQAVQHSAGPDAYAGWEAEARVLAQVATGEVPAGLGCRFSLPPRPSGSSGSPRSQGPAVTPALSAAMAEELGAPAIGVSVPAARGWTVAAWLVAHARQYRVAAVTFDGWRWVPAQRAWKPNALVASPVVRIA